jgi:hypothetical protein
MGTSLQTLDLGWSQVIKNLLGCQWKIWDAQYRMGMEIMESVVKSSMTALPKEQEGTQVKDPQKLSNLEQLAAERMRKGLPPPREIYELPYRERFNWAAYPAWARPTDPELFEDCSHEG